MKLGKGVSRHVAHQHAAKLVAGLIHIDGHQCEHPENQLHGYCTDFPCNSCSVLRFRASLCMGSVDEGSASALFSLTKTGAAEWD